MNKFIAMLIGGIISDAINSKLFPSASSDESKRSERIIKVIKEEINKC